MDWCSVSQTVCRVSQGGAKECAGCWGARAHKPSLKKTKYGWYSLRRFLVTDVVLEVNQGVFKKFKKHWSSGSRSENLD